VCLSLSLLRASVAVQGNLGPVQLLTAGDVLLDAGRGPLSSHHYCLCVQCVTPAAVVLRHHWMGYACLQNLFIVVVDFVDFTPAELMFL